MIPIVGLFEDWGVQQAGLFTFPQSARHIGLYQKFGFWLQHLTPLLERQVALAGDTELDGFAVCHLGAGEAGSGTCFASCSVPTRLATAVPTST